VRAFHRDEEAALVALERIGAPHLPSLDLRVEHPLLGTVFRRFGVLRCPWVAGPPADDAVVGPLLDLLQIEFGENLPELLAGYGHLPVSERLLRWVLGELHRRRLHLPWCFRPMNLDFASQLSRAHRRGHPLSFKVFYSRQVQFQRSTLVHRGGVQLEQVFYLPVEGAASGTWRPPRGGGVDPAVGLVVEADFVGLASVPPG
jgi:hypothetical protein